MTKFREDLEALIAKHREAKSKDISEMFELSYMNFAIKKMDELSEKIVSSLGKNNDKV